MADHQTTSPRAASKEARDAQTLGRRTALLEPVPASALAARRAPSVVGDFAWVPTIAPPLAPPDDPAESDADRVAGQVLLGRATVPRASRGGEGEPVAPPILERIDAQRGRGNPLAPRLRSSLEPLLGGPLGRIRVHDDPAAHDLANDLGATAFALGDDLFFAHARFAPTRRDGLGLLTHELAHSLQARGGGPPTIRAQPTGTPQKLGKLKRIIVYTDLNRVTMRLDNDKLVVGTLEYNGHPNPGTYRASRSNDKSSFTPSEGFGGVPNAHGYTLRWSGDYDATGVTSIMIDVVGGTGTGTGKGAGPTTTPAPKSTADAPAKPAEKEGPKPKPGEQEGAEAGAGTQRPAKPGAEGGKPAGAEAGKPGAEAGKPTGQPGAKGTAAVGKAEPTLTDAEYVAKLRALPPEIKEIMGGEGKFEPGDYERLLAIAEKLKKLTAKEREMYRQIAKKTTLDLTALEQSIDLFFAIKEDIKRQIEAQQAAQAKEPSLQQKLEDTWKGFDANKFARMSADEKEALAREIAAKQRDIQLEHMLAHPGETAAGMVEGIVRPDKVAEGIAADIKEAADGKRNGFARTAAAMGATSKASGWIAGVCGVLFVAMLFVPGANLAELALVGLIAGGTALVTAAAEAELRIQSAKREKDPRLFQSDVEKSAAAQANAIVQAAMLALHVAVKLVAKIPLGPKYQNVGNALRMARTSLVRITGAGEAFDSVKSALLTRLRAARGGLPEALAKETKALGTTTEQIKGMTGTQLLEKIAAGDQTLTEATGINAETAKAGLAAAKQSGSSAVPDQVRQNVLRAFDDAPQQAMREVEQFGSTVDKTIAAVEKAQTPAELEAALDAAEGQTTPKAVNARTQAAAQQYVADRLKSDLAAAKQGTPASPPTSPSKAPAPTAPEGKPTVETPAQPKAPPKPKPVETKPTETKPTEPKPVEAKPTETKPAEPTEAKPAGAQPADAKPAAPDYDLAYEEKLLKQAEKAKAARKAARKKPQPGTSPEPKPGAAVEEAKARLKTAQEELEQLKTQRDTIRASQKKLRERVAQETETKKALLDQQQKAKDPNLRRDLLDRAKAAEASKQKAAAEANELGDEADALGHDIAEKETAVRRAEIDVDPKKHRAGLPCFGGDTVVWTNDGPRPIEDMQIGDVVLSFELGRRKVVPARVRAVAQNRTLHFYEIQAGDETIHVTGRHRFWIEDAQRWFAARELVPGMGIGAANGRPMVVERVSLDEGSERPSWNLAVDGTPHFFVGPGLLVHNDNIFDTGLGGRITIYRATNPDPKFAGKAYIGQAVDVDIRTGGHRRLAQIKLQNRAALTPKEIEFYEFMSNADLEPLVTGLNKDQADFLEQRNMDIEAELRGEQNVMNRRAQIRSEDHMRAVTDRIENDPAVQKAGYCKK